ncbi:FIG035246: DoxX family protein [hydrothermal vent metagenome]|uniref:FIG035246: DoxX family protein n=1 Tax=hydrothermal vent metagenome TaxID=652676 RepID=A0A3B0X5S6_9ZZZZ
MNDLITRITGIQTFFLDKIKLLDFSGPLLLRLYLVPIFWMAGTKKWADMESTAAWFGNPDWGLGLPMPEVLAYLATLTEILGAIFLLVGFAVRWISIPLMVTMVVAAVSVHLQNGWLAIAEGTGPFATERTMGAIERLDRAKSILQDNANYSWLTENGSLVILNNGIEFASTYFIMLLALFCFGPGKASVDHILHTIFMDKK